MEERKGGKVYEGISEGGYRKLVGKRKESWKEETGSWEGKGREDGRRIEAGGREEEGRSEGGQRKVGGKNKEGRKEDRGWWEGKGRKVGRG